jgi:hypothetical protein
MSEAQPLLEEALRVEGEAQRALLAGDSGSAAQAFREAAAAYRRSWEAAPPRAFGRLIGMLKAAIIAGGGEPEARYVRDELAATDSPPSAYAAGIAALVLDDDAAASDAAEGMREGGEAFARTAAALAALAARDGGAYAQALGAIVADFEAREDHLTGVAIADTAVMLERLAERRGIAARPASSVLPGWEPVERGGGSPAA